MVTRGLLIRLAWLLLSAPLVALTGPLDETPRPTLVAQSASRSSERVWSALPVRGFDALREAAGLAPEVERARAITELIYLLHRAPIGVDSVSTNTRSKIALFFASPAPSASTDVVPLPLTPEDWEEAVFQRRVAPADFLPTLLADRNASLLYFGLASLDDETLTFLRRERGLLRILYQRHAGAFAASAEGLRVHGSQVVVPGGKQAEPLWEDLLQQKLSNPTRFIEMMLERDGGRPAYLLETLTRLDEARLKFALGLQIADPILRLERFKMLYAALVRSDPLWQPADRPFVRTTIEPARILSVVEVTPEGRLAGPSSRAFWDRVFADGEFTSALRSPAGDDVDATWLATEIGLGDRNDRRDHFETLLFAQRVFRSPSASADELIALRGFARYRALMLTLERMALSDAKVYAAAVRSAARFVVNESYDRGFVPLALFQTTLSIIERARLWGIVNHEQTAELVSSLFLVPLSNDGRYDGRLAQWMLDTLLPAVAPDFDPEVSTVESELTLAVSGAVRGNRPSTTEWEGTTYSIDPASAEADRVTRIRNMAKAVRIDDALQLVRDGRTLKQEEQRAEIARSTLPLVRERLLYLKSLLVNPDEQTFIIDLQRDITNALKDIDRIRPNDDRRLDELANRLFRIGDALLADTLVAFIYAVHLGDPDGPAVLSGDVSRRHSLLLTAGEPERRSRGPWTIPSDSTRPGRGWRVSGSLLALDMALARLVLRRLDGDYPDEAPRLNDGDRRALEESVVVVNPAQQRDSDRDQLAEAIRQGRARVTAVGRSLEALVSLLDEIELSGRRRFAARWTLEHDPDSLPRSFSPLELYWLGRDPAREPPDAWGAGVYGATGCLCTRFPRPGTPHFFTRPSGGLVTAQIADLNLRLAEALSELGLPAALARTLLGYLTQDFADQVKPVHSEDVLTLGRFAGTIPREQIEDYVAALTFNGPLRPLRSSSAQRPQ